MVFLRLWPRILPAPAGTGGWPRSFFLERSCIGGRKWDCNWSAMFSSAEFRGIPDFGARTVCFIMFMLLFTVAAAAEPAAATICCCYLLQAFHSQSRRKMHRIPATFQTKVLARDHPTTSNQQLHEHSSQLPLTHHIHRAQLKLFGHVFRDRRIVWKGAVVSRNLFFIGEAWWGQGLGEGVPEYTGPNSAPHRHGTGCKTSRTLQDGDHPQFPFAFVQLHRLAVHRHFCSRLVGLPTCRKYFKQTCCIAFSQ